MKDAEAMWQEFAASGLSLVRDEGGRWVVGRYARVSLLPMAEVRGRYDDIMRMPMPPDPPRADVRMDLFAVGNDLQETLSAAFDALKAGASYVFVDS